MERRLVNALRGLLVALAAGFVIVHGLPLHPPQWVLAVLTNGVYFCATALVLLRALFVREARVPFLLIGLGLCCYSTGTVFSWIYTWHAGAQLPFPSFADACWLAFYPFTYAGITIFVRNQARSRRSSLDSLVCGLGGAAVFSAIVVDHVITTVGLDSLDMWIALAYPAGDMALMGLMFARLTMGRLHGWRTLMMIGGFLMFVLADTGYVLLNTRGLYVPGAITDILYLLGLTLLGLAPWQSEGDNRAASERIQLGWSVWFAVGALVVLVVGTRLQMSNLTVGLAGGTLLTVVFRVVMSFRELDAAGKARHAEARKDPLTGLANRRAVLEHLDRLLTGPAPPPVALLLLDLDRFKEVNDTYGHQAGDLLLEQVAARLHGVTRAEDVLARLGGDEFVLVLAGDQVSEQIAVRTALRIRDELLGVFDLDGVSVTIDVSIGVALRREGDVDLLFQQADIAMYDAKRAGGGHALFGATVAPLTTAGGRPDP